MVQRVQSLYLLLTAVISASLFFVPAFELAPMPPQMITYNSFLLILNVAAGMLTLISVFLYRNRRLQTRMCQFCMLLIFAIVGVFFFTSDHIPAMAGQRISYKAGAYLPLLQIVLILLAQRGIRKDEELVRSADRLR